jgi:hypothetical protein
VLVEVAVHGVQVRSGLICTRLGLGVDAVVGLAPVVLIGVPVTQVIEPSGASIGALMSVTVVVVVTATKSTMKTLPAA